MMNKTSKLLMFVAALSISLSGCSGNKHADKDKDKDAKAEQVAMKVNGQPVMAADFVNTSPRLNKKGQIQYVSATDMNGMIDLELLRQAAVQAKLDQDPKIRAKLDKSPKQSARKILGLAYVNQQLSSVPAPTDAEVSAYYNANPAKFAQRKHYDLQACAIKAAAGKEAKIKAQLDKNKKFDRFERWLTANKIKYGCVPVSLSSDHADASLWNKLQNVPAGGSVVEGSKDQMTITFVQDVQNTPLTLDQAKPMIVKMLTDNRKAERYDQMIKQLRDKAKIEYVPPFTAKGLAVDGLVTPGEKEPGGKGPEKKGPGGKGQ
jgi:peptidyl-prolyl cis-trans isomerase C